MTGAPIARPSFILHSHFYQPPREDPWTDRVPREPSADPYHDWNERIHAECYGPVTASRVLDGEGRIRDILNTLEWMSWDAGPTLLRWMARETPGTYRAFLEADARSRRRLGFGNALAAPYHHVILPLASRRDKVTEVRWGISDFRRRFGRDPEGMWLPETAVDRETLEVLAAEGIHFTVLAPHQLQSHPLGGMPGKVRLGRGRSIAVFVYDGPLSHGVAFGSLLGSSAQWIAKIMEVGREPGRHLISAAADGETFGHHHHWSEMALAATLTGLDAEASVQVENYATFLHRLPPVEEVALVEPSSWSCAHGVERWRSECGCKMAPHQESQQRWRTVLREALEELAGSLHSHYEREGGRLFRDPWAARDAYGEVLDSGRATLARFVKEHASRPLDDDEVSGALRLLELERDALRMFTSCGWFFDDLAGLEPLQVLRYAAHALDLAGPEGPRWEARLRGALVEAESNDPDAGDGRRLWDERIRGGQVGGPDGSGDWVVEPHRTRIGSVPGLEGALRTFLRAPGAVAAREVVEFAHRVSDRGGAEFLAAQTRFARSVPRGPGAASEPTREVARALGFGETFFGPRRLGGTEPVGFVFGLHLHQPTGNFDSVFESHTDEVYLPFLERIAERGLMPATLHVSGPLLEWLERRGHRFLDVVGRLLTEGQLEILLAGFHEPVLPALSRRDRVEQIGWMREWISRRFGAEASGLWLTERVWEPDLVEDLASAGVRYAFVDDRHFLVAGFDRHRLHRPFRTESGGRSLTLLPIDERLRYLIPFRPPEEIADYLRNLRANDQPLAILADDGEKFGGWPGTAEWVWRSGWLDRFLDTMTGLVDEGVVEILSGSEAVEAVLADGPAYLPSASYREMEGWSLPSGPALDLEALEGELHRRHVPGEWSRFVRGGHWRNFFAIYPESNRMHAKAQILSDLCRERGDPPGARRAIGRAQCNDAYWHGVFGGLYLAHLRGALWHNLAEAEGLLRAGEPLGVDVRDVDGDGESELWVHSAQVSCVLSPARGGAVTELTRFAEACNLADVLTRRWESYHRPAERQGDAHGGHGASEHEHGAAVGGPDPDPGMPSIHHIEAGISLSALPPLDADDRNLTVERVLPKELDRDRYASGAYDPLWSWSRFRMEMAYEVTAERVEIRFRGEEPDSLEKEVRVDADGTVEILYRWDPLAFPPESRFAPELSLSREVTLEFDPPPLEVWRHEIRTVSKSERGAEETAQGYSVTPLFPATLGEARTRIGPVVG